MISSLHIIVPSITASRFVKVFVPLVDDVSSFLWTSGKRRSSVFPFLVLSGSRSLFAYRLGSVLILLFVLLILPVLVFSSFLPLFLEGILAFWSLFSEIFWMLVVHAFEKFLFECLRERLDMHIIAIASSLTASIDILLAFGIQEVRNWRKDCTNLFAIEEPPIDILQSIFRILLITILDIDISHDMISQVIHHNHILYLPILAHLLENLFKESLES